MERIIGGKDILSLHTWVDAAYAVHENMRSQTGGWMPFFWEGHGTYKIFEAKIEYEKFYRSRN